MSYSPCDFMDNITSALNINLDTDDVSKVADVALAEIERLQAADKLAEANGGTWGEHHTYTPADWRLDVANCDTRSGYWDWVLAQIEANDAEVSQGSIDHMPDRNSDDAIDDDGSPTW